MTLDEKPPPDVTEATKKFNAHILDLVRFWFWVITMGTFVLDPGT